MIYRDDKPFLIQGIARDITERKLAEEALRASEKKYRVILESIEDGYFEVDLAGNVTFFNDSLVRISGYSRDELMGMNNREYTTPDSAKRMYQIFSQVYQTGKPVKVTDHEIVRKDGTTIVLEMSDSLMKDLLGKPIGFQGIARDVSERKMAEEALRQAAALETLTTVLENFISDSLGNLLTPIYSGIQLCQRRDSIPHIKNDLGYIETGITKLLTGINVYRQFTKLREGYLGRISSVDIRSILRPLLSEQSLKTYGEEEFPVDPHVKLQFVYDPEQEGRLNLEELPSVLGSQISIETALQETLINAVESYDPDKDGEVMVSVKKEDHQLILEIADRGRGMSNDEREKSQLPFFKIPGMKKSARFGLGGYIACESAKYCGGDIQIESTKGVGTKASILLKLSD
jgi:PAS domain S-box-containing protein